MKMVKTSRCGNKDVIDEDEDMPRSLFGHYLIIVDWSFFGNKDAIDEGEDMPRSVFGSHMAICWWLL